MGLQWVLRSYIWDYDWSRGMWLEFHMHRDKDLCIFDYYTLLLEDTQNWQCIPVYMLAVHQEILSHTSTQVARCFLGKHCWVHRAKVSRDLPLGYLTFDTIAILYSVLKKITQAVSITTIVKYKLFKLWKNCF